MTAIRSVCVYCGSQDGRNPTYREAGRNLGRELAENGLELVYGGGAKGIMGAVADGALNAGGHVTGVIPQFLVAKEASELTLHRLTESILTDDMHQRKHTMFDRSDAFLALPGGIGTLEEIVEIMTWAQLARHAKPIAFLNVDGFWNPMLALLEHMRGEGFIHTASLVRPIVASDPAEIVSLIVAAGQKAVEDASTDRDIARM
jgi:uncharacterized protein (TIGR00730 family)